MIGGRLYMVPRKIAEQVLVYNASMLQAAGITFDNINAQPWDVFKDICKRLTVVENGTVKSSGAGLMIERSAIFQMFLRGFGGKWIDSVEHKVYLASSNEAMYGINEIVTGIREGWLYPEGMGDIVNVNYAFSAGDTNISSVCFKTFGAMSWLTRVGNAYDALGLAWDFCPMPAFPTH